LKNKISVTILSTIFPRSENDYRGAFLGRMVKSISKFDNLDINVVVPSSKNSPLSENWGKINIIRFKYWIKQNKQKLAYGDGTILNLKSSLITIIQLPFYFISFFKKVVKIWSDTSVFHCQWSFTAIFPIIINALPFFKKKPIIVTFRGTDLRILPGWFNKFIIRNVTACTYVSPIKSINRYMNKFDCDIVKYVNKHNELRLSCIFDPLDESNLKLTNNQFLALNKKDGKKKILSLGRLDEIKNPIYSINIIYSLLRYRTDFIYIIVGYGPLENRIKSFVKEKNLDHYVRFEGAKSNVSDYYNSSDLLLVTSSFDNVWSATIAEAMMIGCPVVLTDAGYTSTVFTNDYDSLIISKNDSDSAAEKINNLLDQKDKLAILSKNAKNTLLKYRRYDQQATEDYLKLYERVNRYPI